MKLTMQGDLDTLAVYAGINTSYFFLLRIAEYAAEDGRKAGDSILRRCDVKFFRQGVESQWHENPDEVSLTLTGFKTNMEGWVPTKSLRIRGRTMCGQDSRGLVLCHRRPQRTAGTFIPGFKGGTA